MQEPGSGYRGAEVVEEEVSIVKPAAGGGGSCSHGYLYLSSLDLCWRGEPYGRRLLFYENVGGGRDIEAMVGKLKSSLAQLLIHFYPAAGRLVSACPTSGRPSILCDAQGVEFVVARVKVRLSAFQPSDFEPCPFFDSLARSYTPTTVDQHLLPLLSIQVTKFMCGGLAIGVSYSNALVDGHSMWHLMNSWAECARNEALSIPPCHFREAFKVENPSQAMAVQFSLPSYNSPIDDGELAPSTIVQKLLHITPHMLEKMKKQACEQEAITNQTSFSHYDVLCAFMWKSLIAPRYLSKHDHRPTNICVLGDMRFRMKPQLPRGYFGNGTIFAYASSFVRDIQGASFGTIAQKIHDACKACNEPRLWALVNWLELHQSIFNAKSLPSMLACINVVSSPKFKVYGVDFGWGKPIAVRPIQITNTHDMVFLPGRDDGIDICLSCHKLVVDQLLIDFKKLTT